MRTYSIHEANQALPEVRRLVGQIVELSQLLPELEDQARINEYRSRRIGSGIEEGERLEEARSALRDAGLELRRAAAALQELGIQLKDAQIGLVDFPAYRDGELVELCWKLGEETVGHWHRIGEGFPGRKPL